jgi:general secretion pathway protein A
MYTKFFGFSEKPFSLVPNPNYLYLSSKHSHALTFLEYGLTEKIGFVMLTGEIGIGKTTLIRHLLNQVEADMDVAVIFNTNILPNDLINLILNEFEIPYDSGIGKTTALDTLYSFLIAQYAANRRVLLIIDEAQNLSNDVLEEIRMLSNIQTDEEVLLQIMIVGQPNLRDKIQDPRLEQFAQRISVSYHLSAMTLEETGAYIAYRLKKVGGDPGLFPWQVVKNIFEATAGIPRTINLLCDAALVYGYADDTKKITLNILKMVIKDKGGMGMFTRQKLGNGSRTISGNQAVKGDSQEKLKKLETMEQKIAAMEQKINQLTKQLEKQLRKSETQAKSFRGELVETLKNLLSKERKRSAFLEHSYGKINGLYNSSINFKKVK